MSGGQLEEDFANEGIVCAKSETLAHLRSLGWFCFNKLL